jgi:hypothetical protein
VGAQSVDSNFGRPFTRRSHTCRVSALFARRGRGECVLPATYCPTRARLPRAGNYLICVSSALISKVRLNIITLSKCCHMPLQKTCLWDFSRNYFEIILARYNGFKFLILHVLDERLLRVRFWLRWLTSSVFYWFWFCQSLTGRQWAREVSAPRGSATATTMVRRAGGWRPFICRDSWLSAAAQAIRRESVEWRTLQAASARIPPSWTEPSTCDWWMARSLLRNKVAFNFKLIPSIL